MKLLRASTTHIPPGLMALLVELGEGEHGFGGTPVGRGEMTLHEYLQLCVTMSQAANLRPGYVPQTVYWLVDDGGEAVGIVRIRHYLNETLRDCGGHIGYYVRRDRRGRGYGRAALAQALGELRQMGERRALLTVDVDNSASIRVIEANGGRLASRGLDPGDGQEIYRYWIELDAPQDAPELEK